MPPTSFTRPLLHWHRYANERVMPWKGEKDPYKIWLSEIILQQTRVEQGWKYYEKFIARYPDIASLAAARDQEVFKMWEGLGYYNRCKNLLFTARDILNNHQGIFPSTYPEILALKGVGPYTAAAISSFAFNLPYAVLDGNVFRVLARFFGLETPIDSNDAKKVFGRIAEELLDRKNPGLYNQAIMDLGATVCTPWKPGCRNCPLRENCLAFEKGLTNQLPVKEKVILRKHRWFTYFVFESGNRILVHKRVLPDIWQNLYEFYLLETPEKPEWTPETVGDWLFEQVLAEKGTPARISEFYSQQLTHQQVSGQFIQIRLSQVPESLKNYEWISRKHFRELPFPGLINQFLQKSQFKPTQF